MSPTTQNEIINIIGYDIILANIISEAKQANYFSVLADELSWHNMEYLSICIRFVDSLGDIREDFLSFIKLDELELSILQVLSFKLWKSLACHSMVCVARGMMELVQ